MCRVMSFVMNTQRETVTAGIGIRLAAEAERLGKLARQPVSPVFRKNTPDTEVPGKFTLGDQCDRLPDFTDRDLSARTGVRAGITAPAQADRPLDRGLVLAIEDTPGMRVRTLILCSGLTFAPSLSAALLRSCVGEVGVISVNIQRAPVWESVTASNQPLGPQTIHGRLNRSYGPPRLHRHIHVTNPGVSHLNECVAFSVRQRVFVTWDQCGDGAGMDHSPTPRAFGKQDVAGFLALGQDYCVVRLQGVAEKSNVARLKVVGPTRTNRHPVPLATDNHPVCWAKIGIAVSYLRSIDSAHIHDFSTQKEVNPPEAFGTWTQPYTGVIG